MSTVHYADGKWNYFHYDGQQRRYAIQDSGGLSYLTWDSGGMNLLCEKGAAGTVTAKYAHGYTPIPGIASSVEAQKTEGGATYYQYHLGTHHGDAIKVLDENQNVVCEYEYNAWGEPLHTAETGASNRFRYQPNWIVLPDSSGLIYISATRAYHAGVGRFLQREVHASGRRYWYARSNPAVRVDPDGSTDYTAVVVQTVEQELAELLKHRGEEYFRLLLPGTTFELFKARAKERALSAWERAEAEAAFAGVTPDPAAFARGYVRSLVDMLQSALMERMRQRGELRQALVELCPNAGEQVNLDGSCCDRERCVSEALRIADLLAQKVHLMRVSTVVAKGHLPFGGVAGNLDWDPAIGSYKCEDWAEGLRAVVALDYAKRVVETEQQRPCFTFHTGLGRYRLLRHAWIEVTGPRGKGPVKIDPWPSGGRRLLEK
jgi:RHS repeat-associated protein